MKRNPKKRPTLGPVPVERTYEFKYRLSEIETRRLHTLVTRAGVSKASYLRMLVNEAWKKEAKR